MKRIAYYGGSFDPVHRGHLAIANALLENFELDEFVFVPAFHAPHKVRITPTSAYDRYAMLCLASQDESRIRVSQMEIEAPNRPFSIETLSRIKIERPDDETYFVMGADSWMDITTWREWESVLSTTNHIVVTRPGVPIGLHHVTDEIRERIVDVRNHDLSLMPATTSDFYKIYLTDLVNLDISATNIRQKLRKGDPTWRKDVSVEVANYIEKYQIYN